MAPLILLVVAIVAMLALAPTHAVDTRPGPDEPAQHWFGRR